jgi:excisionase family DNA binding protein
MNANTLQGLAANLRHLTAQFEEFAIDQARKEAETPKSPYLTLSQACLFLGITKTALYTMTCRKQIPYFKPNGKNIYFLEKDLINWIESKRVKTVEETESEAAALCVK